MKKKKQKIKTKPRFSTKKKKYVSLTYNNKKKIISKQTVEAIRTTTAESIVRINR